MYECFHCGHRAVIWQSDYMFEELGYEGGVSSTFVPASTVVRK